MSGPCFTVPGDAYFTQKEAKVLLGTRWRATKDLGRYLSAGSVATVVGSFHAYGGRGRGIDVVWETPGCTPLKAGFSKSCMERMELEELS